MRFRKESSEVLKITNDMFIDTQNNLINGQRSFLLDSDKEIYPIGANIIDLESEKLNCIDGPVYGVKNDKLTPIYMRSLEIVANVVAHNCQANDTRCNCGSEDSAALMLSRCLPNVDNKSEDFKKMSKILSEYCGKGELERRQSISSLISSIDDMKGSNHGFDKNDNKDGRGLITSQYLDFSHKDHDVHFSIQNIDEVGNFDFSIRKMHGDMAKDHYMRYFLVLDPVGRILGGRKRLPDDKLNASIEYFSVKNFDLNKQKSNLINIEAPMSISEGNLNILNCPYVQVLTEDIRDAIARVTFRLS